MIRRISSTAVAMLLATTLTSAANAGLPKSLMPSESNDCGVFGIQPQQILPWQITGVSLLPAPSLAPEFSIAVSPKRAAGRTLSAQLRASTRWALAADSARRSNEQDAEPQRLELPPLNDTQAAEVVGGTVDDAPSAQAVLPNASSVARLPSPTQLPQVASSNSPRNHLLIQHRRP